jgi:hypothetical protein
MNTDQRPPRLAIGQGRWRRGAIFVCPRCWKLATMRVGGYAGDERGESCEWTKSLPKLSFHVRQKCVTFRSGLIFRDYLQWRPMALGVLAVEMNKKTCIEVIQHSPPPTPLLPVPILSSGEYRVSGGELKVSRQVGLLYNPRARHSKPKIGFLCF